MPTLKAYVEKSEQTGVYILANVGGTHPITLQVTELGAAILEKAGYAPPEVSVPTKVVWAMYDVGLLYTSNVVNNPPSFEQGADGIFEEMGVSNQLTSSERDRLLRLLAEYTGPNEKEIRQLREKVEESAAESSPAPVLSPELEEDLERLGELYRADLLTDEEYSLLKSRALERDSGEAVSTTGNDVLETTRQYLTEEQVASLTEFYRSLLPENSYGSMPNSMGSLEKTAESEPRIYIQINADSLGSTEDSDSVPSFKHTFTFSDAEQEERFRDHIVQHGYEITNEQMEGMLSVKFGAAPNGLADDLSDQELHQEIECCFEVIRSVYAIEPRDVYSRFDWEMT
jgi:hypothetical protein